MYVETLAPIMHYESNELFVFKIEYDSLIISKRKKFRISAESIKDFFQSILWLLDYETIQITLPYFEDLNTPGDCLGDIYYKKSEWTLIAPEIVAVDGKNYIKASIKLSLNTNYVKTLDEASRFKFFFINKNMFLDKEDDDLIYVFILIPIGAIEKIYFKLEP